MAASNFIIATAGHVDHGKSALVQALTGTDPDRLPEEKARGITIDLGFAELNLPSPKGDLHASIIDVPGHENFVRNMIAGVGSIDLALLVVAADDGWMPQTEEHFQILQYLGVEQAVVALTKIDIADPEKAEQQIHRQLDETRFANAPIVRTAARLVAEPSATAPSPHRKPLTMREEMATDTRRHPNPSGESTRPDTAGSSSVVVTDGIEQLKRTLGSALSKIEPQRDVGKPRLFVDRAFSLRGIGTVVTGTLTGGAFYQGQSVTIQPGKTKARIRSIQNHWRESEIALPGTRTAVNLPDLSIGSSAGAIKRGDVIVSTNHLEATPTIDVLLEKSARLRQKEPAARALRNGGSIYFHHGTARVAGKVIFLESDELEPGKKKIAQLRLDSPVLAFIGDRFVIRDRSEQHTLAGGLVLDPKADRRNLRAPAQRKLLTARATAPDDLEVCVSSEVERRGPLPLSALLQTSRFSVAEITAAMQRLRNRNEVVVYGGIVANFGAWQTLRSRASALVDQAHAKNSERPGLDINELRAAFHGQPTEVFETLVSDLCTNDFVRTGSVIARSSHRSVLPGPLKEIAERMMALLEQKHLNPPGRKELVPDRAAQQTLAFLIEQGRIIEVSADLVLPRDNYARMTGAIVDYISKRGPATVSQLRQGLETSRRVLVPLLEKLDRDHVTCRIGDRRVLADSLSNPKT
jgi:selenocysteine-specific elongation factor